MGVQPTAVHAVDQPRRSPTGKDLGGTYAETYWTHKLPQRNDAELERAIASTHAWLVQRGSFLHRFSCSGGLIKYYLSVSCNNQLSVKLDSDLVRERAYLEVCLSIDVFCGQLNQHVYH